jgi:hypothetical protein
MDSVPASRVTAVQPTGTQPGQNQSAQAGLPAAGRTGSQRPPARPSPGSGLVAAWRGVALTGLILAEAGMLVALALAVTFAGLGFGLLLIPGAGGRVSG